ncbi:hypothetical protein G5714_019971 [Onychostoma macrolepis]|uniref:Uncharacterized protein n=1 Tax=Onychostoma macrolepis TaxID=369639 RepID=A0A7J6BZQ7_9TELE|nr:hypothetical protein G5714_019971 [Onychostoma macrolepis]
MENVLVTLTDSQGAITLTVSKEIAEKIKDDKKYAAYIMQQVRSAAQNHVITHCPASLSKCPTPVITPHPASLVECSVETTEINLTQQASQTHNPQSPSKQLECQETQQANGRLIWEMWSWECTIRHNMLNSSVQHYLIPDYSSAALNRTGIKLPRTASPRRATRSLH